MTPRPTDSPAVTDALRTHQSVGGWDDDREDDWEEGEVDLSWDPLVPDDDEEAEPEPGDFCFEPEERED